MAVQSRRLFKIEVMPEFSESMSSLPNQQRWNEANRDALYQALKNYNQKRLYQ
ncbi:hypothetical protein [Nostoc sp. C052]|uniref:hypothetical protein n=1 Tax=Nostoc sp. C052 TaxID=2576902 RepID=UPI0015C35798|nr:hypothetical protein [Nostoc sp. C052]